MAVEHASNDNAVVEVALAGLMHDWGKLLQRAGVERTAAMERMAHQLCPTSPSGYPTHQHVLWTDEVLQTHADWMPPQLRRDRVRDLARFHHRPTEPQHWLIAEADRLASGHDRGEEEPSRDAWQRFRDVPLRSIFAGIDLAGRTSDTALPRPLILPRRITRSDEAFPQQSAPSQVAQAYAEHGKAFLDVLQNWQSGRPIPAGHVCAAVNSLSEEFLATVPAAANEREPDVSLHDHSRLVAALACALYAYHRDLDDLTEPAIRDRQRQKYLIVSGDLSGIQDYLLAMPGEERKGLTRAYRGRSFFLWLLTHAAALRLLEAAGLPQVNCILDAGGRFQVLLPDTRRARDALADVRRDIDQRMVSRFSGRLTINIAPVAEWAGHDFQQRNADRTGLFCHRYDAMLARGTLAKQWKLAAMLCDAHRCWLPDAQLLAYENRTNRERADLRRDAALGRALVRARYAGLWPDHAPAGLLATDKTRDPAAGPLDILGYEFEMYDRLPDYSEIARAADFFALGSRPAEALPWIPIRHVAGYVPRLTQQDVQRLPVSHDEAGGQPGEEEAEPPKPGRIATFGELARLGREQVPEAQDGARWRGLEAIACLKADVDRLGRILAEGFGDNVSLGRLATLSRSLDWFFKFLLPQRLGEAASDQTSPRDYRLVYTVYAGGDDLLLVGPWWVMLRLARDLHDWFARYTGNHPEVTISAGLAIGSPRTPLYALAREAAERLEAAKHAGRNRIALFRGIEHHPAAARPSSAALTVPYHDVFTWPEYRQALDMGQRLDDMLRREKTDDNGLALPSGFVYRLLKYAQAQQRIERALGTPAAQATTAPPAAHLTDLHRRFLWRSHYLYDLYRNVERPLGSAQQPPKVAHDLTWLRGLAAVDRDGGERGRLLKLAAMYALYRNRGG